MLYETFDFGTTESRRFDSMLDYVEFCKSVPAERVKAHDNTKARGFAGRDFAGSWDAVYSAVNSVWPEGMAVLERMEADLADAALPKPVSRRRKTRFNEDDGDELDYDRMRSGQAFWRQSRRQNTSGPATVTIVVDSCAACHVDAEDILWRGAAAVTLAKLLEAAGYRVELWVTARTDNVVKRPGKKHLSDLMLSVCLKRPSDVLDTSTLISAVSGWAFRTLFFRGFCCGQGKVESNLGYPHAPSDEDVKHVTTDQKRIVIKGAFSYDAAVRLIRETITSITSK